jgi:hypothetical protein
MGIFSFPNAISSEQIRDIEIQLQRAHQRLAIRHIEMQQLDPRCPSQAYLQRFYDMNRGLFEVEVGMTFDQP